jgi:hypothetical protein
MSSGLERCMKTATGFTLAAALLAACTTSDNPETALAVTPEGVTSQRPAAAVGSQGADAAADEAIPSVTAVGTSPIPPAIQTAFCQDQVAFMQSVEPQFATAHEPMVAVDGSTTITVTVAKENGIQTFECRLDAGNRFVGVTSTTIQGAL